MQTVTRSAPWTASSNVVAPALQQRAQDAQPLGHGDADLAEVGDVDPRRVAQQPAERGARAGRGLDAGLERPPSRSRAATAAAARCGSGCPPRPRAARAGARRPSGSAGLDHPGQQLLGGLDRLDVEQVGLLARQHQPRLQLEQRRDEHEELGRDLEIELAPGLEEVQVGQHDVGQLDLEQVDLLAQDERQQQVERPGEDLQVELEIGDASSDAAG